MTRSGQEGRGISGNSLVTEFVDATVGREHTLVSGLKCDSVGLPTTMLPALPYSPHTSRILPSSRPLSAINQDYLRICRAFVQLDLKGVGIPFDEPGQRIPVLFGRRTPANLISPGLAARLRFVHYANIRSRQAAARRVPDPCQTGQGPTVTRGRSEVSRTRPRRRSSASTSEAATYLRALTKQRSAEPPRFMIGSEFHGPDFMLAAIGGRPSTACALRMRRWSAVRGARCWAGSRSSRLIAALRLVPQPLTQRLVDQLRQCFGDRLL